MSGNITPVNWPVKNGHYKVIQLYLDNSPFLVCGTVPYGTKPSHSDLLRTFLTEQGVVFESFDEDDGETPQPTGDRYRAVGMGKVDVSMSDRTATFFDDSLVYGMSINQAELEHVRRGKPDWTIRVSD